MLWYLGGATLWKEAAGWNRTTRFGEQVPFQSSFRPRLLRLQGYNSSPGHRGLRGMPLPFLFFVKLMFIVYWKTIDTMFCLFRVYSHLVQLCMYLFPLGFFFPNHSVIRVLSRFPYAIQQGNFDYLVAQRLKCLPAIRGTWVGSLGREDPLEKAMATHSSVFAWRIPWTEEPGHMSQT